MAQKLETRWYLRLQALVIVVCLLDAIDLVEARIGVAGCRALGLYPEHSLKVEEGRVVISAKHPFARRNSHFLDISYLGAIALGPK